MARCLEGWADGLQQNGIPTTLFAILPEAMREPAQLGAPTRYRREYLFPPPRTESPLDGLTLTRRARSLVYLQDRRRRIRAEIDRLSQTGDAVNVVAVLNPDCATAQRAAAARRGPAIGVAYGAEIQPVRVSDATFVRDLLSRLDRVIAISAFTRSLVENWGVPSARITVVHPPVTQRVIEASAAIGSKLNDERRPGPFRVLTICRLVERKGVQTALDAVARLTRAGVDLHYDVVGDGPFRTGLEVLATTLGVTGKVTFHGAVDDDAREALLASCDLFVMVPFESDGGDVEGFGIVYLEAGLFGKPVIGSHSGGISDSVIDGTTGVLVRPRDSDALASEIHRLGNDVGARHRFGEAGRRWALDHAPVRVARQLKECLWPPVE